MSLERRTESATADESLVRNLAAQALAIWPQEAPLFERYRVPLRPRILDVGCGTGEISTRLLELYPGAQIVGVDSYEAHIQFAAHRHRRLAPKLSFQHQDFYALDFPHGDFDIVVCRHLLQGLQFPERVVNELVRVTRPGGWLHMLVEDYGMIHMYPTKLDCDLFWREVVTLFGRASGTDLRLGRRGYALAQERGLTQINVDYVSVDTLRVSREICAAIIGAWRDGYTDVLALRTQLSHQEVAAYFDDMIACTLNPRGYAVWQVPIISGRRPII